MAFNASAPNLRALIYREGKDPLNVTPYITVLTLSKDISEPAGMFEVDLAYTPDAYRGTHHQIDMIDWNDLITGGLMPNDYVELFVATRRDTPSYMMRGYLDNIRFDENGSSTGQNMRQIVLNGRDSGKLLSQFQITYSDNAPDFVRQATNDGLSMWLSDSTTDVSAPYCAPVFYSKIVDAINRKHINVLRQTNGWIKPFDKAISVATKYGVDISSLNTYQGSLDDLLRSQAGAPWGEYFMRDDVGGPTIYFRYAPFLNGSGYFEWDEARVGDIRFVPVYEHDVIDTSLTRSDNEVYTWFTSIPNVQAFAQQGDASIGVGTLTPNSEYGFANPYWDGSGAGERITRARRFGFRPLEVQSPWMLGRFTGANTWTADPNQDWLREAANMNRWLVQTHGNMEYLRSGSITCHGVPYGTQGPARIGDYIWLQRTGEVLYVQNVNVEWREGGVTTVYQVIRGQSAAQEDTHARPSPSKKSRQPKPPTATVSRPRRNV